MFTLHDQPIALDVAFTDPATGNQYPNNWLRLASPEERAAIGIKELPDPVVAAVDQRFYWDTGIPKDHKQLVTQYTAQVKATAGSLLAQTDWYITRNLETGVEAPQSVIDARKVVRDLSNEKEAFLAATGTTDELAAYVTSPEFNNWSTDS